MAKVTPMPKRNMPAKQMPKVAAKGKPAMTGLQNALTRVKNPTAKAAIQKNIARQSTRTASNDAAAVARNIRVRRPAPVRMDSRARAR